MNNQDVRRKIKHPIIDSDGHMLEFQVVLHDYIKEEGGASAVDSLEKMLGGNVALTQEVMRAKWIPMRPFYLNSSRNSRDRATYMLPKLLCERQAELGFDFSIMYPSTGQILTGAPFPPELRGVCCRALNRFHIDGFRGLERQATPAMVIPMDTPEGAVAELEFAKKQGMKVVSIAGLVHRAKMVDGSMKFRLDTLGLDSDYDYDPVWRRSTELGLAVASHQALARGADGSLSNFVFNNIGIFHSAHHMLSKSLILGGALQRVPAFRLGLLEAGTQWALMLCSDLIDRWKKRRGEALTKRSHPKNLDYAELRKLFAEYGDERHRAHAAEVTDGYPFIGDLPPPEGADLDDYARSKIASEAEIKRLFETRFYYGCEPDDPSVALALRNPQGLRLAPMFGSDIGHWDQYDIAQTVAEAYELVEDKLIDDDEFETFMFRSAARFYTSNNPAFFRGTAVESQVARLVEADGTRS